MRMGESYSRRFWAVNGFWDDASRIGGIVQNFCGIILFRAGRLL
jgi:hypothetical protein